MQMLASGVPSLRSGMTDLFSAPVPCSRSPVLPFPFPLFPSPFSPPSKHLHLHRQLPRMLVQLVNQVLETLTHRSHVIIEP